MSVSLKWITPDAEKLIAHIARVSNPINENNDATAPRLLAYLIKHKHWSPFEMASMCVEIHTTRDIARQLLRHRSFSFQELSYRYTTTPITPVVRECRMQAEHNRQGSSDKSVAHALDQWWKASQLAIARAAAATYTEAVARGIANEQVRAVLPEGMTPTRLYMAGTIRSWIHYCQLRMCQDTQKEHRAVASAIWGILHHHMPTIVDAST